jgi:acyl-CoA reductase-like NAD-dependent aldehyde dehydrogenase
VQEFGVEMLTNYFNTKAIQAGRVWVNNTYPAHAPFGGVKSQDLVVKS